MRLSEIMSQMGLSAYPQVALVLFGLIFVAVVVHVLRGAPERWRRAAQLPLEEEGEPRE